jgi:hypothetical protein
MNAHSGFRVANKQGDTEVAIKKIKATLAWRKEFEVDKIKNCMNEDGDQEMRKIVLFEGSTGKLYTRGTDKEGRAGTYPRHNRMLRRLLTTARQRSDH